MHRDKDEFVTSMETSKLLRILGIAEGGFWTMADRWSIHRRQLNLPKINLNLNRPPHFKLIPYREPKAIGPPEVVATMNQPDSETARRRPLQHPFVPQGKSMGSRLGVGDSGAGLVALPGVGGLVVGGGAEIWDFA